MSHSHRLASPHLQHSTAQHSKCKQRAVSSVTAPKEQRAPETAGASQQQRRQQQQGATHSAAAKQNAASPAVGLCIAQEMVKIVTTHTTSTQIDRQNTAMPCLR